MNTIVITATPLLSLQHHCYHCNTIVITATPLLSLQHHCYHCNTIVITATPLLSLQHHCYHCNTIVITATPLLSLQHHCYHCNNLTSAEIETNNYFFRKHTEQASHLLLLRRLWEAWPEQLSLPLSSSSCYSI